MFSHREAPSISKDPVADNTDLYAFVSPDRPDTVTLIANYIPLEEPAGGLYSIYVDNDGDGVEEITYEFRFTTQMTIPTTFLYNVGPIGSLTDPNWNLRQVYTLTKVTQNGANRRVLARDLPCPPVRIGPRSTPDYEALAADAIHTLSTGERVFAGQRDEGFFVDLGSIFDLGTLRSAATAARATTSTPSPSRRRSGISRPIRIAPA